MENVDKEISYVVNIEMIQELVDKNFTGSVSQEKILQFIDEENNDPEFFEEIRVHLIDELAKFLKQDMKNNHYSL